MGEGGRDVTVGDIYSKRHIANENEAAKMYAIIKQANGQSYTSMVFGYYCPVQSQDGYDRYLESIHNQFYITMLNKCNPTG